MKVPPWKAQWKITEWGGVGWGGDGGGGAVKLALRDHNIPPKLL